MSAGSQHNSTVCPGTEQLQGFLQESLTVDKHDSVLSHVESCDRCQTRIEQLAETRSFSAARNRTDAMSAVETPAPSQPPSVPFLDQIKLAPPDEANWREPLLTADTRDEWRDLVAPPGGPDEIGRVGGYRLLRMIGRGGMGIVFEAEDPDLKRLVALKLMSPAQIAGQASRDRFLREAQAMARIRHDHVVVIHQVGEHNGCPFLAMELLKGESLEQRLRQVGTIDADDLVAIATQIASGLQATHACGLIHRDIKPANIWLESPCDRVKLLDFGLAHGDEETRLTHSGTLIGTPAYMSPEQADGRLSDARSDLFSLGCVLYRAASGRAAFPGNSPLAVLSSLASHTPRPVSEQADGLPLWFGELIMQLLQKDPDDRPQASGDVMNLLAAPPADSDQPSLNSVRRPPSARASGRRRLAVCTAFVAMGVIAYLAQTVIRIRDEDGRVISEVSVPAPNTVEVIRSESSDADRSPSPLDQLRREDIPAAELAVAGDGDPARVPSELVAVIGDSRFTHGAEVDDIVWQANGEWLASAGRDGAVRIQDRTTGQVKRVLRVPASREIRSIALSPSGTRLAIGGAFDAVVVVRDLEQDREIFRGSVGDDADKRRVDSLAFNEDGTLLAAVCNLYYPAPSVVRIWDVESGRLLHVMDAGQASLRRVVFGAGSRLYTVAAYDESDSAGQLIVRDALNGNTIETVPVDAGRTLDLDVSRDGTRIAVCGHNQVVVFDADTLDVVAEVDSPSPVMAVGFSHDGSKIVSAGGPNRRHRIEVRDVGSGKQLLTYRAHHAAVTSVEFSPDQQFIASGGADHVVRVHHFATGEPVREPDGAAGGITDIAIGDDDRIAVCWLDGRVHTIAPGLVPEIHQFHSPGVRYGGFVRFSPDGRRIATGGSALQLLSTSGGQRKSVLQNNLAAIDGAFSPDGQLLAVANTSPTRTEIPVFETATNEEVFRLKGHLDSVYCVAFSPDGSRIASGSNRDNVTNHTVQIWDVRSRTSIARKQNPHSVRDIAWSRDGRWIAFASGQSTHQEVTILDAATMDEMHRSETFRAYTRIAFSPDSRCLAAASRDGKLVVYDASSGAIVKQWQLASCLRGVVFSADSRYCITANGNGTVAVYRLPQAG